MLRRQKARYQPTRPLAKVKNAAIMSAVSTIVLYLLSTYVPDMPDPVKASILVLVTAAATYAGGYLTSLQFGEIEPVIDDENDRRKRVDPVV